MKKREAVGEIQFSVVGDNTNHWQKNDVRISGFDFFTYRTEGNTDQRVLRHDALLDANHNILANGRAGDIYPILHCIGDPQRLLAPPINSYSIASEKHTSSLIKDYFILQLSPQPAIDFFDVQNKSGDGLLISTVEIYNHIGQNVTAQFEFKQIENNLIRVICKNQNSGQFIFRISNSEINIPFTVIK